jgi:hypothetical protein
MARNGVLSRCLQDYEWCAHCCLLRCVWRLRVDVYVSSHKSYCISKPSPSFSMTLYFIAINCICNTCLEAHICFQLIVLYGCNFPYAYNIKMQMNTPNCMFCACGCVFNIHYSDLWAQVILMMSTYVGIESTWVSVFFWLVSMWPSFFVLYTAALKFTICSVHPTFHIFVMIFCV